MNTDNLLFAIFSWAIVIVNFTCLILIIRFTRRIKSYMWSPIAILVGIINLYWTLFYGIIEITGTPYTVEMGATYVRPGLLMMSTILLVSIIMIITLIEKRDK